MSHPVGWFEIRASDVHKASRWYSQLCGWEVEPMDGMDSVTVNTGGGINGGITGDGADVTVYVIGLLQTDPSGDGPTRHVLFYLPVSDILTRAAEHVAAHSQRLADFRSRGMLLQVGTFGEPQSQGSMSVFTSRDAAEAFIAGDPFMLNGLVERHEIRSWDLAW